MDEILDWNSEDEDYEREVEEKLVEETKHEDTDDRPASE